VQPIVEPVAPIVRPILQPVAPVVEPIVGPAAPIVNPITPPAVNPIAPITPPAAPPVTDPIEPTQPGLPTTPIANQPPVPHTLPNGPLPQSTLPPVAAAPVMPETDPAEIATPIALAAQTAAAGGVAAGEIEIAPNPAAMLPITDTIVPLEAGGTGERAVADTERPLITPTMPMPWITTVAPALDPMAEGTARTSLRALLDGPLAGEPSLDGRHGLTGVQLPWGAIVVAPVADPARLFSGVPPTLTVGMPDFGSLIRGTGPAAPSPVPSAPGFPFMPTSPVGSPNAGSSSSALGSSTTSLAVAAFLSILGLLLLALWNGLRAAARRLPTGRVDGVPVPPG
jgi:hypothetical protein